MNAPDLKWLPFIKLLFGFVLLTVTATLAAIIALGHVTKDMSYGLDFILGGLSSLSGGFVTWFTITPSSEIQKAFVDKELKTNPEEN